MSTILTPSTDNAGSASNTDLLRQDVNNLIAAVNSLNSAQSGNIQTTPQATIINNGTSNKVLLGFQSGLSQWGLFVAKDGVDVNTNTNLSNFIFNSSQNTFKIVTKGNLSFNYTAPSGAAGSTFPFITHNLGYVPLVIGFISYSLSVGGSQVVTQLPLNVVATTTAIPSAAGFVITASAFGIVDATYFTVNIFLASNVHIEGTVTYYLLQETAA